MDAVILGDGPLGRAIAAALVGRGDTIRVLGRPATAEGRHEPATLAGADVVIEASRGTAVATNLDDALAAGVRRFVIATTAWDQDRSHVARTLVAHDAAAVTAPNLALGMILFGRLVDEAVASFGRIAGWDPYIIEWHRRGKADRPSGTARALASRIIAAHPRIDHVADPAAERAETDAIEVHGIRAGSNPGSHLVAFEGPGEVVELRHAARDRAAYASGALAAADWLVAATRPAGLHGIDPVIDELFAAGEPATSESELALAH